MNFINIMLNRDKEYLLHDSVYMKLDNWPKLSVMVAVRREGSSRGAGGNILLTGKELEEGIWSAASVQGFIPFLLFCGNVQNFSFT